MMRGTNLDLRTNIWVYLSQETFPFDSGVHAYLLNAPRPNSHIFYYSSKT
jgi:hypothetical protein